MKVKFGVIIPTGFRMEFDTEVGIIEKIKKLAIEAEELGYDHIFVYDHLLSYPDPNYPCLEGWTTLCSLATVTTRIRLGTLVACNSFRNPLLFAKMVSTLDHFCNGRLEIGIGAGWYEKEFVAAGLKYRPNMWRIKQLDEALTVLRELWKGKPLTFKGNFYSLRDAICLPPPRQRPHPPLWIGGKGNLMLRVVARHAQVWNTRASIEEYQERLSVLQSIVKTIGRTDDLQRSLLVFAALGKNEAEAKEKLRMVKEQRPPLWEILTSGSLSKKLQLVREKPKLIPFLVKRLIESSPSNVFCGTYEQFVDYLIQFVKIGVNHFAFYLVGQTDLRTLIDEIKMLCE